MDFTRKTYPHFHQAAIATAFTLSIISPASSFAAECETPVSNPLMVNIATENADPCDDQVSLREAITYANNTLGKDSIIFAGALKGQTIEVTTGVIDIHESLEIMGPTDAEIIILKANNDSLFVSRAYPDRIDFNLSNVTLETEFNTDYLIGMEGIGGDIVLDHIKTTTATFANGLVVAFLGDKLVNAFTLTLKNSAISGSTFFGSIIYVNGEGFDGEANIVIENSTISPAESDTLVNSRTRGDSNINIDKTDIIGGTWGGEGSHIIQAESDERATVVISETSIQNTISNGTSIIAAQADLASTIKIIDSNVNNNFTQVVALAGPLQFSAPSEEQISILEISGSEIYSNTSVAPLYVSGGSGSVNILDSKISGNIQHPEYSDYHLPVIYGQGLNTKIESSILSNNEHSIVGILPHGSNLLSVTIEDTSIVNNITGTAGAVVSAGATDDSNIEIHISNSTLSGNHAGAEDDSNQMHGGAIHLATEGSGLVSLTVNSSTLTNNTTSGYGGAIGIGEGSNNISVNINNSIVAENNAGYGSDHDLFGDFVIHNSLIGDTSTSVNTSINGTAINLIGDDEGQTPDTGNNILGQDPLLQGLSLSGGTWVHQLSVDSPAIAAGDSLA